MRAVAVFKDAWAKRHTLGDSKHAQSLSAFLPAALEIQETPPNPLVRWLAWSLLALVLIAIIWACWGQVNIVASAQGKIIPSSRVKQIQPLEIGVVKAILVTEGDWVEQGQALVELDSTMTHADKQRLTSELSSLRDNLTVSQHLLARIDPQNKDDVSAQGASESQPTRGYHQRLLLHKWQQFQSQSQAMQSILAKTEAQYALTEAMVRKLEQTLPIVAQRAEVMKQLQNQQFASEVEYLNVEQERIQQQQDLAAERHRLTQLKAAIAEAQQNSKAFHAETVGTLLSNIVEQQRQIAALDEELTKATDRNQKQILYSPVAGRVQSLAITTVGGVVTAAQPLMMIVPDEPQLDVEVFLENKDIGFVTEGMASEIKVHTFPFTKYGVIDAQIINVSDDAIVDDQQGLIYSMQLRMADNTIKVNGKDVKLIPGMAVTAEVQTGHRRIVEFFLAPLLRHGSESLRER